MAGNGFSHQPIKVEKIATKYRTIKTDIPVPESISMLERMYEIEAQAMHGNCQWFGIGRMISKFMINGAIFG